MDNIHCMRSFVFLAVLAGGICDVPPKAAEVKFELTVDRGAPLTASHHWMKILRAMPVSGVKIRNGSAADASIEEFIGTLTVHGIITRSSELIVPGRSFSRSEKSILKKWIEDLRDGKLNSNRDSTFGLTTDQLLAIRERLSIAYNKPTREKHSHRIVQKISQRIAIPLHLPSAAQKHFDQGDDVPDELEGISCGTALAAVLRSLGLVFTPQKVGNRWELFVADSRDVEDSWPIGWPAKQKTHELVPKLMEFLTAEINDVKLLEALSAIQEKTQLPMLFDHHGMAQHEIEPAHIRISVPARRTMYTRLLRQILFQAKLKSELRVDESGKPFLWVSPVKTR